MLEDGYIDRRYRGEFKAVINEFEDEGKVDKLGLAFIKTNEARMGLQRNIDRLVVGQDRIDVR